MKKNLRTGRTKCLLIRPEFLKHTTFYNLTDVYRLLGKKSAAPPLGLLMVAAMLPAHWELKLVDHDVTPLTDDHIAWADIVFIGGIGPQEEAILSVVRRAHAMGKPVVVGGSGPTLQHQVYAEADYVVSGEAEDVIGLLLDDLDKGVAKGLYKSSKPADMSNPVVPRFDLVQLNEYMFIGVGFTRGCPFTCEFCAQIEIFGREPRSKTAAQVITELQLIYDLGYRGMIDFGYDNLIGTPSHTKAVLHAMADWAVRHDHPFCYSTEATINLAKHRDILQLMQENDFRYMFVGIESADDDVLELTQKAQNNTIPAAEAVKIFNSYGIIIQTGIILGFDNETNKTAQNILDMVQETGVFPALVLPLHALPSTQLSARLQREGRLFGDGDILMDPSGDGAEKRTDTATTGLNFVTSRPRVDIMRDLIRVLEEFYTPENHYQRVMVTAAQLKPDPKFGPGLFELLKLGVSFVKIVATTGIDKEAGPFFWRSLFNVAFTNRKALEMVVALSVMNSNYEHQSVSYVKALKKQVAIVESMGEDAYNATMLAGPKQQDAQDLVQLNAGAAQ